MPAPSKTCGTCGAYRADPLLRPGYGFCTLHPPAENRSDSPDSPVLRFPIVASGHPACLDFVPAPPGP